jgi:archaellum biogenesis ATPase FlaH
MIADTDNIEDYTAKQLEDALEDALEVAGPELRDDIPGWEWVKEWKISGKAGAGLHAAKVTWLTGGEGLNDTPLKFLVDGMIPLGQLGSMSGRDGRGKTLLGMEIAKCVLTGEKLFGEFEVRKGKVFLLLLDDEEPMVCDRLKQLGIFGHPDLMVATKGQVDMKDKKGILAFLQETLPAQEPTLVMIDALYLFAPSGRGDTMNSSSEMMPIMEAFDNIASRTGATVLLVAHDNKAGSDVQGSQSIRNMLKWVLRLLLPKADEDAEEEGAEVETQDRVLQLNKLKMGKATRWLLTLNGPGRWVFQGGSEALRGRKLDDQVVENLRSVGRGTAEVIAKSIRKRKGEVAAACARLAGGGRINKEMGPVAGGRPAAYYWHPDHPGVGTRDRIQAAAEWLRFLLEPGAKTSTEVYEAGLEAGFLRREVEDKAVAEAAGVEKEHPTHDGPWYWRLKSREGA